MQKLIFVSIMACLFSGCSDNVIQPLATYDAIYLDIRQSCGWDLQLTGDTVIWDFHRSRWDGLLHSNIYELNEDGHLEFGDILTIEFEVLKLAPDSYEHPDWICNRFAGIPVRITLLE